MDVHAEGSAQVAVMARRRVPAAAAVTLSLHPRPPKRASRIQGGLLTCQQYTDFMAVYIV